MEKIKECIKLYWEGINSDGRFTPRKLNNRINADLRTIEEIQNSGELKTPLILTIEWKKSYMWGMNPRGSDNYGNKTRSIGGCGYDKLSTATAELLNQNLPLLRLMLEKKEESLKDLDIKGLDHNKIHREMLGYGSGYGVIPRFEGGVGVDSHRRIIEGLGLKWQNITSTKTTDVFMITK